MFREKDDRKCFVKNVEVRDSSIEGFGVFSKQKIKKHEIVERCPIILFTASSIKNLSTVSNMFPYDEVMHKLADYVFEIIDSGLVALPFGYGCIYNHGGKNANCKWTIDQKDRVMNITATRDIEEGEELLVKYVLDPDFEFTDTGTMSSSYEFVQNKLYKNFI